MLVLQHGLREHAVRRRVKREALVVEVLGIKVADGLALIVGRDADAAIVGSVFVRAYAEGGVEAVKRKVEELKPSQERR
jgi:tryptophan synthase alpha subunit